MASALSVLRGAARHNVLKTYRTGGRGYLANHQVSLLSSSRRHYHEHVLRVEGDHLVAHPFTKSDVNRKVSVDLPHLWLRDNCRCTSCVNQDTMQRNYDTFELHEKLSIESLSTNKDEFRIKWSDSHESTYKWPWLQDMIQSERSSIMTQYSASPRIYIRRHANPNILKGTSTTGLLTRCQKIRQWSHIKKLWTPPTRKVWQSSPKNLFVLFSLPFRSVRAHTRQQRLGFCFIDETPKTPEATQAILEKIGPIRNTHYGGFYDFIPDLALADTAYTNLPLAPHTDTTYFSEPAGLQAFHLLSHTPAPGHESSEGGQSVLVDGFAVASQLDPATSAVLEKIRVPWHASGNDGIAIVPDQNYPVIERADSGKLRRVRWNNDDRGTVPVTEAKEWYKAARKFSAMVSKKENQYWFQLVPGRMLSRSPAIPMMKMKWLTLRL